jgi:nucleoside-diphosphate-sugar epimerase
MGNVLVTGASGFIGGHLAEALLHRGNHVRCLLRRSSQLDGLQSSDVEIVYGDLTDDAAVASAVQGMDVVFHIAGLTRTFRKSQFWEVNERGTANVALACAKQQTPPVHVYVSSIAASGPAAKGQRRTEADPAAPVSNYGRSKLAGERAAAAYAATVPTTIVRPGIVFGPRNLECFPIFQTIEKSGIHPVPGFRSPPLSYIQVHDLIDLLLRAAKDGARLPPSESNKPGHGYYYATTDEHPSYAEFGRMIARELGRRWTFVIPIAMPTLYTVASFNELIARFRGKPNHFNIDKMREANVRSWACAPTQAQSELDFQPIATLQEHLAATVAWYREHGWLSPAKGRDRAEIRSRSPLRTFINSRT